MRNILQYTKIIITLYKFIFKILYKKLDILFLHYNNTNLSSQVNSIFIFNFLIKKFIKIIVLFLYNKFSLINNNKHYFNINF